MTTICAAVARDLGAFVDGELRGPARARVFEHLGTCAACAREVERLRALGELLRASVDSASPDRAALAGLASTVLSRTRAEEDESWAGTVRRATEDWHWVLVGSGSIAATLTVTLLASAVLVFGPKPLRADSLAAIVVELTSQQNAEMLPPNEHFFIDVAGPGVGGDAWTLQVDTRARRAARGDTAFAVDGPTNDEVVRALFDATHNGRGACAAGDEMVCRRAAENLSQRVTGAMLAMGNPMPTTYAVKRLRLLTSVAVYDRPSGS